MLASRALQHRIKSAHQCWSTGLTTHAVQIVDIFMGKPPSYLQWFPPEAYPEPVVLPIDADGASCRACHPYLADGGWPKPRRTSTSCGKSSAGPPIIST